MFKLKKAFTLAEIVVTLCVLGTLATLTVVSTTKSDKMKASQLRASTKVFYTDIDSTYQDILLKETGGFNITKLYGYTSSAKNNSQKLFENFRRRIELSNEPCNKLPSNSYTNSNDIKCGASPRGFYVSFYLDSDCENTYDNVGYYDEGITNKKVYNSCGYIAYAPKRSKGIIGEDFFVIALDKRRFK